MTAIRLYKQWVPRMCGWQPTAIRYLSFFFLSLFARLNSLTKTAPRASVWAPYICRQRYHLLDRQQVQLLQSALRSVSRASNQNRANPSEPRYGRTTELVAMNRRFRALFVVSYGLYTRCGSPQNRVDPATTGWFPPARYKIRLAAEVQHW